MAKGKIEQEIALKVTGAKEAKEAEKLVERLDGETAAVTVTVEDKATADARRIAEVIDGLSAEDKTIVLTARADQAEREIKKLTAQIGRAKDAETITIKVNALGNARAELDRISDEMRKLDGDTATVKVEARGLDEITDQLGSLPGAFGQIGSALGPLAAGGPAVAGAGALATAVIAAGDAAADLAIEAGTYATLTGASVEDASRLLTVLKQAGVEYNDIADITVQVNQALATNPELAERLGINLNDGKNAAERLLQVIKLNEQGLIDMTDASTLFGEEGIRQMARVKLSVEDITRAMLDLPEGAIVTDEDVRQAQEMRREMAKATLEIQAAATSLGQQVVPYMEKAAEAAQLINTAFNTINFDLPDLAGVDMGSLFTNLFPGAQTITRAQQGFGLIKAGLQELGVVGEEAATDWENIEFGGGDFEEAQVAIDRTAESLERAQRRSESFADSQQAAADAQQELVDASNAYRDALNDQFTAMTNVADLSVRASDAQADFAEAATEAAGLLRDNGKLVDDSVEGQKEYADAVARQRETAVTAARTAAELAQEQAEANGQFFSGVNQLDMMNESLLNQARYATPAARQAIIDYLIEMNQIPADKATEIQALVDAGKFDEAQAKIAEVSKAREVAVTAVAHTEGAETEIQELIKARNMTINAQIVARGGAGYGVGNFDQGGTVDGLGGIAGERGPEIVDGKYLAVGPTYVPPGTRVTSRARTTQILKSGRHRFRTYDQGGVVPVQPVTNNNVVVHLPAGADGADVVRQVRRWERRNGALV